MTEIRHWSYFPGVEAQKRFATALRELGYFVERMSEDGPEPNKFCVCFWKLQDVDKLEQIWEQLQELSVGCDGEYDGHEFALDDEAEDRVCLN